MFLCVVNMFTKQTCLRLPIRTISRTFNMGKMQELYKLNKTKIIKTMENKETKIKRSETLTI